MDEPFVYLVVIRQPIINIYLIWITSKIELYDGCDELHILHCVFLLNSMAEACTGSDFVCAEGIDHVFLQCVVERFNWELRMATPYQQDTWYVSLLGLAEHFRTSNPPDIKRCVHCLQTVFTFKPPPHIEARTHLQIGTVLSNHTKNTDLALSHLDLAVRSFSVISKKARLIFGNYYNAFLLCKIKDVFIGLFSWQNTMKNVCTCVIVFTIWRWRWIWRTWTIL